MVRAIERIILEGVILQIFARDAKHDIPRAALFFNRQVPPIEAPWPSGVSIREVLNMITSEYGRRKHFDFGECEMPTELEKKLREWITAGAKGRCIQLKRVKKKQPDQSTPIKISCKVKDPSKEKPSKYSGGNFCQLLGRAMKFSEQEMMQWQKQPEQPDVPQKNPPIVQVAQSKSPTSGISPRMPTGRILKFDRLQQLAGFSPPPNLLDERPFRDWMAEC